MKEKCSVSALGVEESDLETKKDSGFFFWFRQYLGVDLRALALTRISLAFLVLVQLLILFPDIGIFYTDQGILNRENLLSPFGVILPSLFLFDGGLLWAKFLFILHAVSAFFLLVGFKTRFFSVLVWVLYLSLVSRNWMVINSGDILLLLMLFWGIFVPWGARFSLDNLAFLKELVPKRVVSVGTVALLLQMPLAYFFTGVIKSIDSSWSEEFSAVFYALGPEYINYGGFLLLQLGPRFLEFLTAATLLLEILGPVFLFLPFYPLFKSWFGINFLPKTRTAVFFIFALLQLGFVSSLSIGPFPFIGIAAMIPILPSSFFDSFYINYQKFFSSERPKLKVYYDGDCSFCYKMITVLRNLSLLKGSEVSKAQSNPTFLDSMNRNNSWVVIDEKGSRFFKFKALLCVLKRNIYSRPLYFLLNNFLVIKLGDRLYEIVANNRARSSTFLSFLVPSKRYRLQIPLIFSLMCALFLVLAVYSNIVSTRLVSMPQPLHQFERFLFMNQNWRMFSTPFVNVGYIETEGWRISGEKIDLTHVGGPLRGFSEKEFSEIKEPFLARDFSKNHRWRKYFENLRAHRNRAYLEGYSGYVCRAWNEKWEDRSQDLNFVSVNLVRNQRNPSVNGFVYRNWVKENIYFYMCP